jgi:hypothetical protein
MLFWQINDTIAGNNIFLSETAASTQIAQRWFAGECSRARSERLKRRGKFERAKLTSERRNNERS